MQVNSEYNLKSLKVGDHVQYDSPTVINNHHWIWQGTVTRVTWKFVYITWTHANCPVFPGPIVEKETSVTNSFTRAKCDMNITLIVPPAPEPVVISQEAKDRAQQIAVDARREALDEVVNADTAAELMTAEQRTQAQAIIDRDLVRHGQTNYFAWSQACQTTAPLAASPGAGCPPAC